MPHPLSYTITSRAPESVNNDFFRTKEHFHNFYNDNVTTHPRGVIMKNLAHITLKRQFYLNQPIRDEEVRSALAAIRFQPISITADKLDVFKTQQHGNILVALVTHSDALQELHDDLATLLDPGTTMEDTRQFNPHLSILYRLPEEQMDAAREYVSSFLPIHYTLESFLFLREIPGVRGEREVLRKYPADNS